MKSAAHWVLVGTDTPTHFTCAAYLRQWGVVGGKRAGSICAS
ncbi:MAG TPA: hypothetical protein VK489_12485 [Ferruginibacter sp.]|nr:hypothetical protein [Ferruginibacter sp.]